MRQSKIIGLEPSARLQRALRFVSNRILIDASSQPGSNRLCVLRRRWLQVADDAEAIFTRFIKRVEVTIDAF